jgi:class 3 adenylate cyclase/tetratricopeptide (TPR) repeat protein
MNAELRAVTVMFCDIVGSTAMSEQLDPEELLEVVHAYQTTCREIIDRNDGHIAQYLGDGILVYFGYPQAHDDDVQRSVHSALEILDAIGQLNEELGHEVPLVQTRIGIHTGPVVAGALAAGSNELLAMGNTPNVAARLQDLAEPNSVVVSAASQSLVEGYFRWRELGEFTLKGITDPIRAFEPLEESSVRTPFELAIQKGLRRLAGRTEELESLRELYRAARGGTGQIAHLSGEGGIGKSRLLHAIREDAETVDGIWLTGRCAAQSQNTALYPVLEALRSLLGFTAGDTEADRLNKLQNALADSADPEKIRLLADLFAIDPGPDLPELMLSPELARSRTLATVQELLLSTSRKAPLVITIEDLHWVDPSTLEFLERFATAMVNERVLLLLSYRPSFEAAPAQGAPVLELRLSALDESETRKLVVDVSGEHSLPEALIDRIVDRTDGVPLFVEELTKAVLEAGDGGLPESADSLDALSIPSTLESLLRTRLDRLGSAKPVVQLAAVVGREFNYSMLENLGVFDKTILDPALDTLVEAELLGRSGSPPDAHYTFRHALIQDAAYQSLLRRARREYHGRIAETAIESGWEVVSEQPEFVAHHFTDAGMHEQGVEHWLLAGQQALERSANAEAIAHFTRGLEVIEALPDERPRWERELALSMGLGPALTTARGYGAAGVEEAYNRALSLCRKLGDPPEIFWVLWGLGAYQQARGQHREALDKGREIQRLAESRRELQAEAQFGVGTSLFYLGDLVEAREELEKGSDFFVSQVAEQGLSPTGHHAGVMSLGYLAIALWHLGYPEQSMMRCEQSIELAERIGHPFVRLQSLHWATFVHFLRRDRGETRRFAQAESTLSAQYGFPFGELGSAMTLAWLEARNGERDAVDALRGGVDAYRGVGARVGITYFLAMLADACLAVDRIEDGLAAVDEGFEEMAETGERVWEAELYRLKGELVATRSSAEAVSYLDKAQTVAHGQQARSLELRSALSLAALAGDWQPEGLALVADLYKSFGEGLSTTDLVKAKRLLEK